MAKVDSCTDCLRHVVAIHIFNIFLYSFAPLLLFHVIESVACDIQPRYFDFISFAQFLTITSVIAKPQSFFVEAFNAGGEKRVVRRDTIKLPDSKAIEEKFVDTLGQRLLSSILESGVGAMEWKHLQSKPSLDTVVPCVEHILNHFFESGYCLERPYVYHTPDKDELVVKIVGPATLWGMQALRRRQAILNNYDLFVVESFLKSAGSSLSSNTHSDIDETAITRHYMLRL